MAEVVCVYMWIYLRYPDIIGSVEVGYDFEMM